MGINFNKTFTTEKEFRQDIRDKNQYIADIDFGSFRQFRFYFRCLNYFKQKNIQIIDKSYENKFLTEEQYKLLQSFSFNDNNFIDEFILFKINIKTFLDQKHIDADLDFILKRNNTELFIEFQSARKYGNRNGENCLHIKETKLNRLEKSEGILVFELPIMEPILFNNSKIDYSVIVFNKLYSRYKPIKNIQLASFCNKLAHEFYPKKELKNNQGLYYNEETICQVLEFIFNKIDYNNKK